MSAAPETIPEFNRSDFTISGHAEGTFRYPLEIRDSQGDRGYIPLTSSEDEKLSRFAMAHQLSVRKNSSGVSILHDEGYDVETEIGQLRGTVIEVGGPTPRGYELLRDIDLPARPIITNRASAFQLARPGKVSDLTALDRLTIDFMADAGQLPLGDKSVGIMMSSCLNYISNNDCAIENVPSKKEEIYNSAILKVLSGKRVVEEKAQSPRVAFLLEASRLVKDDGIVIIRGVDPLDIKLANSLGFAVRARTVGSREGQDDSDADSDIMIGREVVLQKVSDGPVSGKMEKLPVPLKNPAYKRFLGKIGLSF